VANLPSLQDGGWSDRVVRGAMLLLAIVLLVRWINRSLLVLLDHSLQRFGHEKQRTMLQGLSPMISSLFWVLGTLIFLQNQGFELSAVYASLAGAGLGIGLALRSPIANFLDYLTIILDEPIQIGQIIGFADVLGVVEQVGIRSTAIRSLSGEKVLVSNGNLLNQTIRNYGDLHRRRLTQLIRVVQQTPVEKVAAIPSMVKQVIAAHGPAQFERCHLIRFIDGALEFEFIFFVPKDDFNLALDLQQAINLDIMRQLAEKEIELA
jgi:small-conductance mechanosensitive channel